MPDPASRFPRATGFTLMEMMVVMILLGVIAGLGFAGFDRMDPGSRGLQIALENFIEGSRGRARASGQDVRVVVLPPPTQKDGARLARYVFRAALEAGFEPAFAAGERILAEGGARLGAPGRCGAGLDLLDGGTAAWEGSGGRPEVGHGFALEMDLLHAGGDGGRVCEWLGLIEIGGRRGAGLLVRLRAGEAEFMSWVQLEVPPHFLRSGRWQHLRVAAADGQARVWVDGELAAQDAIGPEVGTPTGSLRFGAVDNGFRGKVDEVLFWSRVREDGPEVPAEMQVVLVGAPVLHFDRDGLLDAAAHPDGVRVAILEGPDEIGAFTVGRFTQEAPR